MFPSSLNFPSCLRCVASLDIGKAAAGVDRIATLSGAIGGVSGMYVWQGRAGGYTYCHTYIGFVSTSIADILKVPLAVRYRGGWDAAWIYI